MPGTDNNERQQSDVSTTSDVQPTTEALAEIQAFYDAGQSIQAYHVAQRYAPIKAWTSAAARTLGGRVASNLGGYRTARVLHWLAWKSNRTNPDLIAYHGHGILQRRGPLVAMEFLERIGEPRPDSDADGLMHYYTLWAI